MQERSEDGKPTRLPPAGFEWSNEFDQILSNRIAHQAQWATDRLDFQAGYLVHLAYLHSPEMRWHLRPINPTADQRLAATQRRQSFSS